MIIRLAVMMCIRFPLSLRNVKDLLHERDIDIPHETVRFLWNRLGPLFPNSIRKCRVENRSYSNWAWHLDKVLVRINKELHHLWRALDYEGDLEAFVTKRRDRKAALKFLRKATKRYGGPGQVITDKLPSYNAALRDLSISHRQVTARQLNNRAKYSHQPLRGRDKTMNRFRFMRSLQKCATVQSSIHKHFNLERHFYRRYEFKENRSVALAEWRQLAA